MILDLTGKWQFREVHERRWHSAMVPGCVHTDLLANGLIDDPFFGANELDLDWIESTDFEYRTWFAVPPGLLEYSRIELVAEGLDTVAEISINGIRAGAADNMFLEYRFDVKRYLKKGRNTITVRFGNPLSYIRKREGYPWFEQPNDPVGGASGIRKMQCSFGWDWGPRLPTCGIYRPLRIEGGDGGRIVHVGVHQKHEANRVTLRCIPEVEGGTDERGGWRTTLSLQGETVSDSPGLDAVIEGPRLWWPNGHGNQTLYLLTVERLTPSGAVIESWKKRIGLRTLVLDRKKDRWGESFRFVVNGSPVYAKGANWIPVHSFPSSAVEATYRDLIRSAAEAHFTMLRVWGGGIYEPDLFYDLCDEYGIMVWQDFMFACSLYPHDRAFFSSVAEEACQQTRRLGHHACMALWCGNNELEQYHVEIEADAARKTAYRRVFYELLPETVEKYSPQIAYWPSSPHNPEGYEKGINSEIAGDAHFWEVWHGRKPPEEAQRHRFRFWSEFGMQSYCSTGTASRIAGPGELNIFGPPMDNHQKHPMGNVLIAQYLGSRYRYPKDMASLVYLSQVNQCHCVGTMVEHQRGCMPRTMGSLYWQLNDCWPAFSWSSIDFGGRWKGLHYAARRFYAPALVTFRLIGEETTGKINRRINTIRGVRIITVYDGSENIQATLRWDLYVISSGRIVCKGEKNVSLRRNRSMVSDTVDLSGSFSRFGRENLVMRLRLDAEGGRLSENTVFFTAPRFIDLPRERIVPIIEQSGKNRFTLHFRTDTFQHCVAFDITGTDYRATDNFFDCFPGVARAVSVVTGAGTKMNITEVKRRVQVMSVAGSY